MKSISKFKLIWIAIPLLCCNTIMLAQSNFTIEGSQVISNFKFTDSQNTKDKDYVSNFSGAYNLGYLNQSESGVIIRAGFGMRKGGASLVYDGINYNWSLQYLSINAGAGYLHGDGRLQPYLTIAGYVGMLLKANQTINTEDFDILVLEEIKSLDFGIITSLGVHIKLSDDITAFTEYSYLMGLQNIETGDTGQKSSNVSYVFTLGLAFAITNLKSDI
ncbi:MAG: outer membrane beta-barrel protein [Bacteroidetes bacterium]|nr:outer membrane beta-barrel protein [Bacteroidota bacterium]